MFINTIYNEHPSSFRQSLQELAPYKLMLVARFHRAIPSTYLDKDKYLLFILI